MASLVPTVLEILQADIEHAPDTTVWGAVSYPRIHFEPE